MGGGLSAAISSSALVTMSDHEAGDVDDIDLVTMRGVCCCCTCEG